MLKHLPTMEVSRELPPERSALPLPPHPSSPVPTLGAALSTKHFTQPASLLPGAQCLSGPARGKEGGSPLQEACAWLNPRFLKPPRFLSTPPPPHSWDSPGPEAQAGSFMPLDLLSPNVAGHMPLSEESGAPPPHADVLIYRKAQQRWKQMGILLFYSQTFTGPPVHPTLKTVF